MELTTEECLALAAVLYRAAAGFPLTYTQAKFARELQNKLNPLAKPEGE